MHNTTRYGVAGGAAVFVTAGLTLWMAGLIAVDFMPQDKITDASFDINPVAEDIAPPETRQVLKPYEKVETPPPPTKIEITPSGLPSVDPTDIVGDIPPFEKPEINTDIPIITVSDADAQPILRPLPLMPSRADRSGHCKVAFDVSAQGAPFNVRTTYCSQRVFENASIKAVQKWKFKPKSQGGQAVAMRGVQNQITFKLTDERGNPIPE